MTCDAFHRYRRERCYRSSVTWYIVSLHVVRPDKSWSVSATRESRLRLLIRSRIRSRWISVEIPIVVTYHVQFLTTQQSTLSFETNIISYRFSNFKFNLILYLSDKVKYRWKEKISLYIITNEYGFTIKKKRMI